MKLFIKIFGLVAIVFGISQEGVAQSPCFPGMPVTGAYATGGSSANKDHVFWLTWGATYNESKGAYPYGKAGTRIEVGSKSYGSIDLGGGRYMCVEAEIILLNVSGNTYDRIDSYIPGNFGGDFLADLYNIGGSGANNKMASGIINTWGDNRNKEVDIVIRIKATTGGEAVKLRGIVLADAESLAPNEYIYATGVGNWSVTEVKKNIGAGSYDIRKETNIYTSPPAPSSETILFEQGNDSKTGAIAFLQFKNNAYDTKPNGYAVEFSSKFFGKGKTAIAVGLLTSGYDFGDAPASYGKPIHLIDDIDLGNDGITPVLRTASTTVKNNSRVNVNTRTYNSGSLTYSVKRYLGSTPPDADTVTMYSKDAKGDDNTGLAGATEEDAWPEKYRRFADKEYYKPGDKITAVIPYKKALKDDVISGWIDFNLNGTFDESERISATIPSDGDGQVTLEWTVPSTRKAYSTYVRLRYFGRGDQVTTSPTGNALNGEVEDHRIYILSPGITNPMLINKS